MGDFHDYGAEELVDELQAENERLREQLRIANMDQAKTEAELAETRGRLTEIIGYCAQEGHDGEPWDTINGLATGELQLRVTDREDEAQ